jgi:type I restriction enzyme, S subunit
MGEFGKQANDLLGQKYVRPWWWALASLEDVTDVLDTFREPINNQERQERIAGKSTEELFPYFGATGQVGLIDDYKLDGQFILLGEDGAPFLEPHKAKAYMVEGKVWVNNHAHILTAKINPKFLCFYLNSVDYSRVVTGTTRLKLNQRAMRKIAITIPPLNEQHRIVTKIEELFSELDQGVESLKTTRVQLKTYRQSLLKAAFEGRLTEQWRKETANQLESAEVLLERIRAEREARYQEQLAEWEAGVDDWESSGKQGRRPRKPQAWRLPEPLVSEELKVLPDLPSEWFYVRLGEIGAVGSGMSVSKSRKLDDPLEVPYLRVANVQRGKLDLDNIKTMFIERSDLDHFRLSQWDVLFNEGGDRDKLGRGWIWEGQLEPCITQNHVFRVSAFLNDEYHAKFISMWGNTFGRSYFEKVGKQTTNLASINKTVLNHFPVPLVPYREQKAIVEKVETIDGQVENLSDEIDHRLKQSEQLRQSILKRAFEGKLVPQDPSDEPASELLERIRQEQDEKPAPVRRKRRKQEATADLFDGNG